MTPEQRNKARHALGLPNKNKQSYRNRYICQETEPDWTALVATGMATMQPAATLPFGGDACFYLTTTGAKMAIYPGETLDPEDFPDDKPTTNKPSRLDNADKND